MTLNVTLRSRLIFGYSLPWILVEALKDSAICSGFPDPHDWNMAIANNPDAIILMIFIKHHGFI